MGCPDDVKCEMHHVRLFSTQGKKKNLHLTLKPTGHFKTKSITLSMDILILSSPVQLNMFDES